MDKKEFLDILRQSLDGEVDNNILEQSIKFYNGYISSHSDKSEKEIISEIGDPRLIAKTIIDTEKLKSQRDSSTWSAYDSNRSYKDDYSKNSNYDNSSSNRGIYRRIKWYHKVAILAIVFLLLVFLLRIGWIFIKLSSMFFMPMIIIGILWVMFRNR